MALEDSQESFPQAIAFVRKKKAQEIAEQQDGKTCSSPDTTNSLREGHRPIPSSLHTVSSVSPLRSEPLSIQYEEHILVKTIREQSQKKLQVDHTVKLDPPILKQGIKKPQKEISSLINGITIDQKPGAMIAQECIQEGKRSPENEDHNKILVQAEKAKLEIEQLEQQLSWQEKEAQRLAEAAQAMVAQLEVEAVKKSKAAQTALLKAKLALKSVDDRAKKDLVAHHVARNIAEKIRAAEKETEMAEDRVEVSSVPSPRREERQGSSIDGSPKGRSPEHHQNSLSSEIMAINENMDEIAEPPKIVRRKELLSSMTRVDPPKPESLSTVGTEKKSLSINVDEDVLCTDGEQSPRELAVSPLHDFESPRKSAMTINTANVSGTMDTIYTKIEQCQEILMNSEASVSEHAAAAELMTKMAKVAKITEGLMETTSKNPDNSPRAQCRNEKSQY